MTAGLRELARLHGVQAGYRGNDGRMHMASEESLLAVLACLDVPARTPVGVRRAVAAAREAPWACLCPPVAVAWGGAPARLDLRVDGGAGGAVHVRLTEEAGGACEWGTALADLPVVAAEAGGRRVARRLRLPADLAAGYHRLELEAGGRTASVQVIAAPRRAPAGRRGWGVFVPLYALRGEGDWGAGRYRDLAALAAFVGGLGGDLVGTLPLHPTFPDDPSPYAPVSRLFWNELYLDIPALAEFSPGMLVGAEATLARLREAPRIDYAAGQALRREVLAAMAAACQGAREEALRAWTAANPEAVAYARFRAYGEANGLQWPGWHPPARDGRLPAGAWDPGAERYHLYAQWCAAQQVAALPPLYLDLPLGVHRLGYDAWRHARAFALGASMGAPPDALFAGGQNWGSPPPHPRGVRVDGYRYLAACLRHVMARAAALRMDHIMGLHRLFWIPAGGEARDGVYVRYAAEEMYAVLTLEAARHGTLLVGEDLGTVPAGVRGEMARHGLLRMYVLPFARTEPVPRECLACLDTHDMPPFAAWWRDLGEGERDELAARIRLRPADPEAAYAACLDLLAQSAAELVMVNLEDLWLETEPQNRPGTAAGNWDRPARHGLPGLTRLPAVAATLRRLDGLRR